MKKRVKGPVSNGRFTGAEATLQSLQGRLVEADLLHRRPRSEKSIGNLRDVANGILCFLSFHYAGNVGIYCRQNNGFLRQSIREAFGIR